MNNRSRLWTAICNGRRWSYWLQVHLTLPLLSWLGVSMDTQRLYINKTPHCQETTQTRISHKEVPVQNYNKRKFISKPCGIFRGQSVLCLLKRAHVSTTAESDWPSERTDEVWTGPIIESHRHSQSVCNGAECPDIGLYKVPLSWTVFVWWLEGYIPDEEGASHLLYIFVGNMFAFNPPYFEKNM